MRNKTEILEKVLDNEIQDFFKDDNNSLEARIRRIVIGLVATCGDDWWSLTNAIKKKFHLFNDINIYEIKNSVALITKEIISAIRREAPLRKKKKIAREIGLNYWPALVYGPEIDPIAYLIAEEILYKQVGNYYNPSLGNYGGWDWDNSKGLSARQVARFWWAAGCKDGPKFRFQVRNNFQSTKRESLESLVKRFKGHRWLENNGFDPYVFSNNALKTIGRLSAPLRWAAMKDVNLTSFANFPRTRKVRNKDLNLAEAARVQGNSNFKKAANCPVPLQWQLVMGCDMPDGLTGMSPIKTGLKMGLYKQLCKQLSLDPFEGPDTQAGHRLPCWRLAQVFRSFGEVKQFAKKCGKVMDEVGIHDLGQFPEPTSSNPEWKRLALKFGFEIVEFAGRWGDIEKEGIPTSIVKFREAAAKVMYDNIKNHTVALAAAKCKMSQIDFESYQEWYLSKSIKKSEHIPAPARFMSDRGIKIRQLRHDDPLAPLVGLLTNCCQHPRSAGASCATAAIENPNCAIWVFEKDTEVIAQTFVWRHENILVIDSIEAKDHTPGVIASRIGDIFMKGIKSVLGRFGIDEVRVGDTPYGITGDFINWDGIWGDITEVVDSIPPVTSYSDAVRQVKLCIG